MNDVGSFIDPILVDIEKAIHIDFDAVIVLSFKMQSSKLKFRQLNPVILDYIYNNTAFNIVPFLNEQMFVLTKTNTDHYRSRRTRRMMRLCVITTAILHDLIMFRFYNIILKNGAKHDFGTILHF